MTPNERRAIRALPPKIKLNIEHTISARVLPDRETLLAELPKNGVVAEIGAAFGDFSMEILERCQPSKLHLIDAWDSQRYETGIERIEEKFVKEIEDGRIVLNRGMSVERIQDFPLDYFDWVYIDTDHSYQTTLAELNLCAPRIKSEGIIAGHDYCVGNIIAPWPYGVIEACHQFCVENGWRYRYLTLEQHGHFSFGLTRI